MSTALRHGLSVGVERVGDSIYMTMAVVGKLTHEDYQTITPMLDNAVAGIEQPEIHVLIDARGFEGWDLHAAWDDFKLGMKHRKAFKKIAIVGDKQWEKTVAKIGGWFIGGDARFFEDYDHASEWICSD